MDRSRLYGRKGPKWAESGPKWTEWTGIDRSRQSGLSGLNRPKWTKVDRMD